MTTTGKLTTNWPAAIGTANGTSVNTITKNAWASTNWSNTYDPGLHVKGPAVFEGDITWNGRNMRKWFEDVEKRLAILHPNPELEREWEQLAALRQQYVELERELIEKQRTFDILKKSVD